METTSIHSSIERSHHRSTARVGNDVITTVRNAPSVLHGGAEMATASPAAMVPIPTTALPAMMCSLAATAPIIFPAVMATMSSMATAEHYR